MASEGVLKVKDLSVDYGYGVVVDRISLTVRRGEVVAIVGANGAGKSSLLRAMAGFTPSRGTISLGETQLTRMAAFHRARHGLVIVPDNRGLFPSHSVRDHLWLAMRSRRPPGRAITDPVYELFPRLYERRDQAAGLLSGGEQQMLTFAMALVMKPQFLLLDEMSTGLAPIIVQKLLQHVREMSVANNMGIVLVEQFVHDALAVADSAMVLGRGQCRLRGPAVELRERIDDVTAAYFA